MPKQLFTGAFLAFAALVLVGPAALASSSYMLGPSDKVRVTVSEWSPASGEFRSRLDGAFTIGSHGGLSLPLIGEVSASGLKPDDIARAISERFQARLGLIEPPSTSIEIVEHRPFFIVGSVERPGNYPFRPGMTVLHAVSIAGGLFRRNDVNVPQIERDVVSTRGDLRIYATSRDELLARRARLQAELGEQKAIQFPPDLSGRRDTEHVAQLMRDEDNIIKNRRLALQSEIDTQKDLKALAENQAQSLRSQEAAQRKLHALVEKELSEQRALLARGLSTSLRVFPLETRLAEIEAKARELEADVLRAQQDIVRSDQAMRALTHQRRAEVLTALKETETRLEEIAQRSRTAERIIQAAQTAASESNGEQETVYSILRQDTDQLRERIVSETAAVDPGDIVRVFARLRLRPSDETVGLPERDQAHASRTALTAPVR